MNPHQKKSNKNNKNPKPNTISISNQISQKNSNPENNFQNISAENLEIKSPQKDKLENLELNQNLIQTDQVIEKLTKNDKKNQNKEQSENNSLKKIIEENSNSTNNSVNLSNNSTQKDNSGNKKNPTILTKDKTNVGKSPFLYGKIMATFFLGLIIFGTIFVNSYVIPEVILGQTDGAIAAKTKKESEDKKAKEIGDKKTKLETENKKLSFMNQKIAINIKDFGTLKIDLKENAAPKTVENFVRLTSRGYFDGTVFHRMVKSPTFSVIQGGDPTATGSGGETASGEPLVDEVWKVKPQSDPKNPGKFLNTPEFTDSSLYKNFDLKTGQVTYPKGQILMAKTSAPDSASSQFFITLTDTVLPAEYTIFGVLQSESFTVLDKISKEIEPISGEGQQSPEYKDGKPNKELKIESATIL